ncbi:MAG: SBBP repeat-containing protein [candidate division Zixibacteria bacterium]|nr:SBBP repeat-containing protein [candidate division Zixibacteria bacterium]
MMKRLLCLMSFFLISAPGIAQDDYTAWVMRYNGPVNLNDEARSLHIGSFGNVYVNGYSIGSGTGYDYLTMKYNSIGDNVWMRRYNGPGSSDDEAWALAIDDSGNVYVTGYSMESGTGYDYATIKYGPLQVKDTLTFLAYSPVDIIVTDPPGDSIGLGFNTIPNAVYDTTQDVNGDDDKDDLVIIPEPLVGEYIVRIIGEPGSAGGTYTLAVRLNGNEDTPMVSSVPAPEPGETDMLYYTVLQYLRGDANSDGSTTVSDVIFLINYLFRGGKLPEPMSLGDANCCREETGDCVVVKISVADVIYLISFLFRGGPAPCS